MSESPIGAQRPAPGSHIADPAPLGLAAFALTTFVLMVFDSNIVHTANTPVMFGLALAYGGIAQLVAGLWEFAKGNTFGATAFCSFGGFWLSYWYLTGHTDLTGTDNKGVGVYLLAWAIFTAYMAVAASQTNLAVLAVFVLLALTFLLLSISAFDNNSTGWLHFAGYVGLLTALAAWYASFAGVTAFTFKRQVLPVGPRS